MVKNTMGTKLPRKLEQKMTLMGKQIRLARLRRNLSIAQSLNVPAVHLLRLIVLKKVLRLFLSAFMPVFFTLYNWMATYC